MQYKKDELRALILTKAEKEFFDKGYNNASLRQIAKQSGTTIGNLYNYFTSKEALFDELVKNEYNSFIYLLENHSIIDTSLEIVDLYNIAELKKNLYKFFQSLMPIFTKRFVIMVDLSEGTKYRSVRDEFIEFMYRHFSEHMEGSKQNVSPELSRLVAVQILYGIIYIIRNYEDENVKQPLICDLFLFNIVGAVGILNN